MVPQPTLRKGNFEAYLENKCCKEGYFPRLVGSKVNRAPSLSASEHEVMAFLCDQ